MNREDGQRRLYAGSNDGKGCLHFDRSHLQELFVTSEFYASLLQTRFRSHNATKGVAHSNAAAPPTSTHANDCPSASTHANDRSSASTPASSPLVSASASAVAAARKVVVVGTKPVRYYVPADQLQDPKAKSVATYVATYEPQKAKKVVGHLFERANKPSIRALTSWFTTLTHNYSACKPNPKPLLILMSEKPGLGKTFALRYLSAAHSVDLSEIDPLEFKQKNLPKPKETKKPTPTKPPTTKPKQRKPHKDDSKGGDELSDDDLSDDLSGDEDGGGGGGGGGGLRRLMAECGQSAEVMYDLMMPSTSGRPRLLMIRDVALCKPSFLKYLFALCKQTAKMAATNPIVLEMTFQEAYGEFRGQYGEWVKENMSLGTFLTDKCQGFCRVIRFNSLSERESRDVIYDYRRLVANYVPVDPYDHRLIQKVVSESNGDIRQLVKLLDWFYLTSNGEADVVSFLGAIPKFSLAMASRAEAGEVRNMGSELEVGYELMRVVLERAAVNYESCERMVELLRSFPLLQVIQFYRSWTYADKQPCPDKQFLNHRYSGKRLEELLLQLANQEALVAARAVGNFTNFAEIKELPISWLKLIGGRCGSRLAKQWAIETDLLDAILNGRWHFAVSNTDFKHQQIPPKDQRATQGGKRKIAAQVSVDAHGCLDFNKLIPRRKPPLKRNKPPDPPNPPYPPYPPPNPPNPLNPPNPPPPPPPTPPTPFAKDAILPAHAKDAILPAHAKDAIFPTHATVAIPPSHAKATPPVILPAHTAHAKAPAILPAHTAHAKDGILPAHTAHAKDVILPPHAAHAEGAILPPCAKDERKRAIKVPSKQVEAEAVVLEGLWRWSDLLSEQETATSMHERWESCDEATGVFSAQVNARTFFAGSALTKPDEWTRVSQWIHPKRYDFIKKY